MRIPFVRKNRKEFILSDPTWIFALLLALTVITRFSFSFGDATYFAKSPESLFGENVVGLDFRVGVIYQASMILQGLPFYTFYQNYGPAVSMLFAPVIQGMANAGLCLPNDFHLTCIPPLYHIWLGIFLCGFLLFFWMVTKNHPQARTPLLVFLCAFFLGIAGNLGLERGNVDIMLSLLSGGLLLMLFHPKGGTIQSTASSLGIGFISGFITNSKFFLLPLALTAIISSKKPLLTLFAAAISFVGFALLPLAYGAPSPIFGPITNALYALKSMPFAHPGYLWYNHAFTATGSLFTDCVKRGACDAPADTAVIYALWIVFFLFTFVGPLIDTRQTSAVFDALRSLPQKIAMLLQRVVRSPRHPGAIMFLASLSVASFNLLPIFALNQRLYFSIPILLLLYTATEKNSEARYYCILSMVFLLIKGLWIFTGLRPEGFYPFEVRGMNFFVILHFFFLLKSSLAYWFAPAPEEERA